MSTPSGYVPLFRNAITSKSSTRRTITKQLYGVFSTYKGLERSTLELYWLAFDIDNQTGGWRRGTTPSGPEPSVTLTSFCTRLKVAFSSARTRFGTEHSAGFFTSGIGKGFEDACWSPEVWVFYDYASVLVKPETAFTPSRGLLLSGLDGSVRSTKPGRRGVA